jgi:hypothetical protein
MDAKFTPNVSWEDTLLDPAPVENLVDLNEEETE